MNRVLILKVEQRGVQTPKVKWSGVPTQRQGGVLTGGSKRGGVSDKFRIESGAGLQLDGRAEFRKESGVEFQLQKQSGVLNSGNTK